jgi:hypothetical protein
VEPRAPVLDPFHQILQNAAFRESTPVSLQSVADAIMDYRPRNEIAFSQYRNLFQRHPEGYLTHSVNGLFSGKGASQDHPRLQKLVHDSLVGYPELRDMYSRS